jgi:hypothetical protein
LIDNLSLHTLTGPYQWSMLYGIPDWHWLTTLLEAGIKAAPHTNNTVCRDVSTRTPARWNADMVGVSAAMLSTLAFRCVPSDLYQPPRMPTIVAQWGRALVLGVLQRTALLGRTLELQRYRTPGTEICRDGASQPFCDRMGATYAARHASKSFLIHRDRHSWGARSFLEDSSLAEASAYQRHGAWCCSAAAFSYYRSVIQASMHSIGPLFTFLQTVFMLNSAPCRGPTLSI